MSQVADAIAYATAQIGKPYVFGASGPDAFDCSGLIMEAYAHANPPVHMTHFTGAMLVEGKPVSQAELEPGDVIFPDSGHCVLYIGNNQMIEAPHSGAVVRQGPVYAVWQIRRFATDNSGANATLTGLTIPSPIDPTGIFGVLWDLGKAGVNTLEGPVSGITDASSATTALIKILVSPSLWMRLGAGLIGFWLIIIGLLLLFRRPINNGVMKVAGVAGGAVSTYSGARLAARGYAAEERRMALKNGGGDTGGESTPAISAPPATPKRSTYRNRHDAKAPAKRTVTVVAKNTETNPFTGLPRTGRGGRRNRTEE